ncbi:bifunctional diguanylate cyclase/phosphodiesterase [Chitinasiproducens palmae]|uniref:Diguanylate cyclase (GGDEF) domain-containing protein n=1 Tax=Chitinasiproducens palmae TaxID=1770053 RepID=A0A1H2PWJ5_9BURK|nr:EAL domain-containing protein [Chitinasiproducens palmae]SDV50926.1 diguanylate cyclase (GGDEF) domain-containing protein [Chitinasiproducens palmae]
MRSLFAGLMRLLRVRPGDVGQVERARRPGSALTVPLLGLLLIGILWGIVIKRLDDERTAVFEQSISNARLLSSAFAEHTLRSLRQLDQLTRFVKYEYESDPARFDLQTMMRRGVLPQQDLLQIALIGSDGRLRASSVPNAAIGTDLSDREHFHVHTMGDEDRLYVSKPVLGRVSHLWSLQLTRRLNNPDGGFGGVVVVSVNPRYFSNDFYNGGIFEHDDMIAVLDEDGAVLSRRTSAALVSATASAVQASYPPFVTTSGVTTDPVDDVRRIFAYQRIPGYPLAVVVALSEAAVLESFQHTRTIYRVMTGIVSLAIIAFVGLTSGVIGQLSERERAMSRLAQYDPLTGLANRWRIVMLLRERLASQASVGRLAVLLVGLDNFKVVNDTLGHREGDEVIKLVARRLQRRIDELGLHERAILGRIAGDGYIVIVEGDDIDTVAARLATTLGETIRSPAFERRGVSFDLRASIGIALHTRADDTEDELLRKCDVAMYAVKDSGKGRYAFFQPDLALRSERLIEWEQMLRDALAEGQIYLEYQPKVDLRLRTLTGLEALLRWRHPRLGLIPAAQFIPIAETLGMIVPIGEFALEQASRQLAAWHAAGLTTLSVAVNVSPLHFWRGDLLATVERCLAETGIPPESLEIELTETAAMTQPDLAAQKMLSLKRLGLRIALDDFGTGHSSLAYLHRFPVDTIKIDRVFVSPLPDDLKVRALVASIVGLANAMKLGVVIEGIETEAQLRWLSLLRCHRQLDAQGFLFSPSVLPDEVPDLVERCKTRLGSCGSA